MSRRMARRHVVGVAIAVVGLGLSALQVLHAVEQTAVPLAQLFEAGPFVLLGLSLAYTGLWLAGAEDLETDADRILAWGVGGLALFLAVAALILFGQNVARDSLARGLFVATDLATIGALAGVIVGLYDARSRTHRRQLADQRDRVQTFANRAADVNNYGRALNQCGDLDDVAALLVQAVATLLDLDEAAVLEREADGFRVVESSIGDVEPADLEPLADRTATATQATVETQREDLPPAVAARTDRVLGLLVTDTVGPPVVVLALGDGRPIADETVQLFELLVAHAGTALDGIYAQDDR
jgi:hypothetical protein